MIAQTLPGATVGSGEVIVDLVGKERRRTLAVPYWVKQSVEPVDYGCRHYERTLLLTLSGIEAAPTADQVWRIGKLDRK